jgi:hypothetical protein
LLGPMLDQIEEAIQAAGLSRDASALNLAERRLDEFERRKDLPSALSSRVHRLRTSIAVNEGRIKGYEIIADIKSRYYDACERHDVIEAARLLSEAQKNLAGDDKTRKEFEALQAKFKESVGAMVDQSVGRYVHDQKWDQAQAELDKIVKSDRVRQILDEEAVALLKQSDYRLIWVPQERYYYSLVCQDRTEVACRRYLESVKQPTGRVRTAVLAYQEYLESLKTPKRYNLAVDEMLWGANTWDGYNYDLAVEANRSTVVNGEKLKTTSAPGKIHRVEMSGFLPSLKPSDRVTISAKLNYKGSPWYEAKAEFFLSDLRDSKVIELSKEQNAKLWVHVERLPEDPGLATFDVLAGK